ncbi:unnamed protein product [Paramecium sonneborni]|uniref:Ankyrin repeat-containing domain n=1 Tax=Paramecium sonneborni TaxID=65129 RepID=A0A8S1L694_9CILI|nr:unnamed protein product [Paramecium sonneborni]
MINLPIQIETQQYKYYIGNEEKSFQIKKKAEFYQFQRFKTTSDSFHETNHWIDKKQQQRRMTLDKSYDCSNLNAQKYIDYNVIIYSKQIKEKYQTNELNEKVKQFIIQDKKLMRKQIKVTKFEDLLLQYQKSFRQKQMKKQVLDAIEQEPLTLNLKGSGCNYNKMRNSNIIKNQQKVKCQQNIQKKNQKQQHNNTDSELQDKIQNYLSRKSVNLQRLSQQMDDINISRKFTLEAEPIERQIKTQTNFFKDLGDSDSPLKEKDNDDYSALLKQSYKYWEFAIKTKKDLKKKRKTEVSFNVTTQTNLEKMKSQLLHCIHKLKYMKLLPEQLIKNQEIIKQQPYQRDGSYLFFKGIGKNDLDMVKLLLEQCRFYAFDVNENFQTALHICSRKGYLGIAKMLFEYGTYPEAKDANYKTPLYYALVNKQKEIVRLLLSNKCNPWSSKDCCYESDDPILLNMLKIARKINLLLVMIPYKQRQEKWINYARVFSEM